MTGETEGPRVPSTLEARDLEVRRGGQRVLGVQRLVVESGSVLAVIGPNGAGKSTLLMALALLLPLHRGTVVVQGEVATKGNSLKLRRRMAVVFQEPLLLDTSVRNNVGVGLRLRGAPSTDRDRLVAKWLERFAVARLRDRSARSLSGGEAQRVSLARAFALEPEILFLDEPFSALDAPTRAALTMDLAAVLRESRTTTVLVTHDRDEALALGSHVGVMIDGGIRQVDAPEKVFGAPVDAEVAAFVGVENIVPGAVSASEDGLTTIDVGGFSIEGAGEQAVGSAVLACLRPEDVTLLTDPPSASSARNSLRGRVVSLVPLGGQIRVTVDCGFPLVAAVTRRSASEMDLVPGCEVSATFKAVAVHLIAR